MTDSRKRGVLRMDTTDYGPNPYITDIEELTKANDNFRVSKWTGKNLQLTVMSIPTGGEIGLEVHNDHDQFLRIEDGNGRVEIGPEKNNLNVIQEVGDDDAIIVPAGMWHNITNAGNVPLKLYSIYAPPEHPQGTIHKTYADDPEHSA
jgi:mannose-6-phosphate isomerase-like protein (cupin superfamily)